MLLRQTFWAEGYESSSAMTTNVSTMTRNGNLSPTPNQTGENSVPPTANASATAKRGAVRLVG
ncbi:hypothetical protein L207DRAFT_579851 [Hyaloscypha variabilis F]|uniref:Uncharacterized protein n=1 Tax=Hyaloscypha variabilis (strain UAMH 11265 / GT02V1 / F) TaxID=1149755 RepID=A0A2J6RWU1_HYAVF|nr:hypothetical protein L207DRAFT_579851 [Hyaloscypha variabilis F]